MKEGKYIYCIIETKIERNFGPIGIGGRGDEVSTIGYGDLSMVISNSPMTKYVVSRENLLAHEKVIEEVMKEFTVLPVRFCTIASNADEVRNLLDRRYREFKNLLRDMDHKIELGTKGLWKNMDLIFKEIIKENHEIKRLKEKMQNDKGKKKFSSMKTSLEAKVEVGKLVEEALKEKKDKEAEKIGETLRRAAIDYKRNKTIGDEMFINAAFLIDRGREKEFDNIMEDLSEEYKDRIKFMYAGPLPPFNFVNIVIYPEEWEK
ncbi:MAG: GvpL/GvpF family gas vesicle protein [Thermodesulfobacteriota bacterium]|nr:GvpL/GvpF family gas vesicle protein [Thermodesulfobacteriota bacterium]